MRFLHLVRSCQQGEARPPTHFCRSSFPLCQTEPGGDRGKRLSPRSYAACGRHLALCPQGTSGLRKAGPSPHRTDRRCPRPWALARPPSSPEPRVSAPAPGEQHSLREAVPSSPEASAYGSCHIVPALSWNRHRGLRKCVRTSSFCGLLFIDKERTEGTSNGSRNRSRQHLRRKLRLSRVRSVPALFEALHVGRLGQSESPLREIL